MTASAICQWFFHPQVVPSEVRKDALARVGVHAVLLTVLIWYLRWIVPPFAEMFWGSGAKLPWAIRMMIYHSDFVWQWFYLLVPFLIAGLVADYRFYIFLYLNWGKISAQKWAYRVTFLLIAFLGFYVLPVSFFLARKLKSVGV